MPNIVSQEMPEPLGTGLRIRFTETLREDFDNSPDANVFVTNGDTGEIIGFAGGTLGVPEEEGYSVKADNFPDVFLAFRSEFDLCP